MTMTMRTMMATTSPNTIDNYHSMKCPSTGKMSFFELVNLTLLSAHNAKRHLK